MKNNTILILGGYGASGRPLARLILQETEAEVIVAGRHIHKAEEFAAALNAAFPGDRAYARFADAGDPKSLAAAFQHARMVVVTATTPMYAEQVARAALQADCDYLDILLQQDVISALETLSPEIRKAERIFIAQGGLHPGLIAPFIRHAAPYFDDYQKAAVGMAMNARIETPESMHELIRELGDYKPEIFRAGSWRKATYKDMIKLDFGPKFGVKKCYPLPMAEVRPLPEVFDLKETGVYAAGFNWFVDNVVFPLAMAFQKTRKGMGVNFLGKLMRWGLNTFSSPDQGVVLLLEAEGLKDGRARRVRMTAEHDDAYFLTAAPVAACLIQYLDNTLSYPGLWLMGNYVDHVRLIDDLEKMGVEINVEVDGRDSRRESESELDPKPFNVLT